MKLWKIMQRSLGAALAVVAADFSRYEGILERNPFGEVAPPAVVAEPGAPAASETFAKDYELKSIIEDVNRLRVGILNKKTSKHIYLNIGQELEGLQLVAANYETEEAVLKIGLETITIKLHPDKDTNKTVTAAASTPRQPLFGNLAAPDDPGGARKPFFADMKRRGASPFQRLGTNAPKGLESFFKPNTNVPAPFFSPFRPQGSPFKPEVSPGATWPQTSAPPFPFAPFGAPAAGGAVAQPSGAEPQPPTPAYPPAYYPPPQMPFEMPVEGEEIEEDLE